MVWGRRTNQVRRVLGIPAQGGGMAPAVGAHGQGGNGCSSRAWASLIHCLGCPWECQGMPSSIGRGGLTEPWGSLCSWRGDGASQRQGWERAPVPPAASQHLHMCVRSSTLHKGTSEAPELGLALAHPQWGCQLQAAGAAPPWRWLAMGSLKPGTFTPPPLTTSSQGGHWLVLGGG